MNGYPVKNSNRPTLAEVRTVWAWLSEHPRASMREAEKALKKPRVRIHACMVLLEQRGLIECDAFLARARRIVVPLLAIDGDRVRLVQFKPQGRAEG